MNCKKSDLSLQSLLLNNGWFLNKDPSQKSPRRWSLLACGLLTYLYTFTTYLSNTILTYFLKHIYIIK